MTLAEQITDKQELITILKTSFKNQGNAGGLTKYTSQGTTITYSSFKEGYELLRCVQLELAELQREEAIGSVL